MNILELLCSFSTSSGKALSMFHYLSFPLSAEIFRPNLVPRNSKPGEGFVNCPYHPVRAADVKHLSRAVANLVLQERFVDEAAQSGPPAVLVVLITYRED